MSNGESAINRELTEYVESFTSPPFLFIGSGLSKRYLNTPNWTELMRVFVSRINTDPFAYNMYEQRSKKMTDGLVDLPTVASLISDDFNEAWYNKTETRTSDELIYQQVKDGVSPIKAEIAHYLKGFSNDVRYYKNEVSLFENLCHDCISGIVTTNYDTFFDRLSNFTVFVGQEKLLTSQIHNIAEIYKIHGCVTDPNSLVFDHSDYERFNQKTKYLSAKLLTVFLEYPVIFLGYSIGDPNIKLVFDALLDCLDAEKKALLKKRLLFIDYSPDPIQTISDHTISLGNRYLEMKKIVLNDYMPLLQALSRYRMKLPVRIVRHLKNAFYEFSMTTKPSTTIQVLDIADSDMLEKDILVSVGVSSSMAKYGLLGIEAIEIYKDIVLNHLDNKYKPDDILLAIEKFEKSFMLPKYKYISRAQDEIPQTLKLFEHYDDLLSKTTKDTRDKKNIKERSVKGILKYHGDMPVNYMQYLREEEVILEDLQDFLLSLFMEDDQILKTAQAAKKSDIRRLIRIYDFLKYKRAMT